MNRRTLLAGLMAAALPIALAQPSGAIPGPGALGVKNMEWEFNAPGVIAGSDIEFLEMKQPDGSLKRYTVVGSMGSGFHIYDITTPGLAILTGTFVDPGVNWQGDVQVNPKKKIVAIATEGSIGTTASHLGDGVVFVDVSNPALPRQLGKWDGPAHNVTLINDQYAYTTNVTANHIIDYSNPASPVDKGSTSSSVMCPGHDITLDPNRPNIAYNGCGNDHTFILDVTNPLLPKKLADIRDTKIETAHQADPNIDSSLLFITDERGGGITNVQAPGGGVHVWDISGKYVAGASITTPKKLGAWWPPFFGAGGNTTTMGRWGNVTSHNETFQSERNLLSIGWYTAGTWVADMSASTLASGGVYESEWKGNAFGSTGGTTWGNTVANILLEGDEVWSSKWSRFDDPAYERYIYNNGMTRGLDILRLMPSYALPKKQSRLKINATAPGGIVTGKLDRYAVWTFNGWENKPLAGKSVTVSAPGKGPVTVTTAADGTFSANLGLSAGVTPGVTASWAGEGDYRLESVTQTVTV